MAGEWTEALAWTEAQSWSGVLAPTVPAAPTGLTVTPSSGEIDNVTTQLSVTFDWTPSVDTATSQQVWRSTNGGAFISIATFANNTTDTYVLNLLAAGTYAFYVTATNSVGTSAPSNTVTVTVALATAPSSGGGGDGGTTVPETRLSCGIYDAAGTLLVDASATAQAIQWTHGPHGAATCTITLTGMDQRTVMLAYRRGGVYVRVTENTHSVWRGEVEDWSWTRTSITLTAFGAWSALSLVPYSAFWSASDPGIWQEQGHVSLARLDYGPRDFDIRITDTVRFLPRTGSIYYLPGAVAVSFRIPKPQGTLNRRTIKQLQLSYTLARSDPNMVWYLDVYTFDTPTILTSTQVGTSRLSVNAQSGAVSGSATLTFAEDTINEIMIVGYMLNADNAQAGQPFTGSPATNYLEISSARVLSTTAATVTPTAIAADIVAHTVLHNPGKLSASTDLVSVTMDLGDVTYDDADGAEVLDQLAGLGVPGGTTPLEVGIGADSVLYMRPRLPAGAGDARNGRQVRVHYLQDTPEEARYTLSTLVNAAYGTSRTSYGIERTTPTTDSASAARYGRTRMIAVDALPGGNALVPQQLAVSDHADPNPGVQVEVTQLFNGKGDVVPLNDVRPGDYLALSAAGSGIFGSEQILRIRIAEATYTAAPTESLSLVLEHSPPRADVLMAQLLLNQ